MTKRNVIPFPLVRRVPLAAVLERYGLLGDLKRIGTSLTGCCPIHRGSNRKQFVVDPARDLWKCFSPHHDAGGGVLEFVAEFENVTKREAAGLIARWFALAPIEHRKERRRKMAGERPSHKAFVVEDRGEGEEQAFWTKIGSAWPHKDGKGLNVVLAALPANGRIVLREYTDEDAAEDDKKAASNKSKRR
ncbi:CHC2 zinc finger domain-containing protein [Hyphomicrobium sp.]|uniref:CHC2 zinc finger domain-containing protein n=1 Tax=Hyphomicrobium sp. TaxID=82 RepID=UPI002E33AAFE|nr:CHC2 zinc finger domain-containing protein [Hyphomicrobium sp.]HEX2841394.1 CHC2 zinc finger domain-containing protein [Hyphomicrobium sp.]